MAAIEEVRHYTLWDAAVARPSNCRQHISAAFRESAADSPFRSSPGRIFKSDCAPPDGLVWRTSWPTPPLKNPPSRPCRHLLTSRTFDEVKVALQVAEIKHRGLRSRAFRHWWVLRSLRSRAKDHLANVDVVLRRLLLRKTFQRLVSNPCDERYGRALSLWCAFKADLIAKQMLSGLRYCLLLAVWTAWLFFSWAVPECAAVVVPKQQRQLQMLASDCWNLWVDYVSQQMDLQSSMKAYRFCMRMYTGEPFTCWMLLTCQEKRFAALINMSRSLDINLLRWAWRRLREHSVRASHLAFASNFPRLGTEALIDGLPQPGPPPDLRMRQDQTYRIVRTPIYPHMERSLDVDTCGYSDCKVSSYRNRPRNDQRPSPSARYADIHSRRVLETPQATTIKPENVEGELGFSEDALREALRSLMASEQWRDVDKIQKPDIELAQTSSKDAYGYPLSVTSIRKGDEDVVADHLHSKSCLQRPPCLPARPLSSRTSRDICRRAQNDTRSAESLRVRARASKVSVSSVARRAFSVPNTPVLHGAPLLSPRVALPAECSQQRSPRAFHAEPFDVLGSQSRFEAEKVSVPVDVCIRSGVAASSPRTHGGKHARSRSSSRDSRDARKPWR